MTERIEVFSCSCKYTRFSLDFVYSMSVAQFREWIKTGAIPKSVAEKKKNDSEKVCPLCGGALVLRVAKFGPKPGSQFYGCKNFPECRYTAPYEEEKAKEDN